MSFLEINEGQSSEERNIIYSQIPVAKESAIVTEFWQQLRGRQLRVGKVRGGAWGRLRGALTGGCWPGEAGGGPARSLEVGCPV